MTLFTSENKQDYRNVLIYAGVTVFCLMVFVVYDQFSHGVRSPYMTWLFAWPLVLGVLPSVAFLAIRILPRPGRLAANLYHSGVAALAVSSLLRGIFEIAGTSSDYQAYLMIAGAVLVIAGVAIYLVQALREEPAA